MRDGLSISQTCTYLRDGARDENDRLCNNSRVVNVADLKIVENDPEKLARKVLKHYERAREACLKAVEICGDIDASTLENCLSEVRSREDVDKSDIVAISRCLDYVKSYMTASVAELEVSEERIPDIGLTVFVVRRPGASGERAVSVRVGVHIDPHGDNRSRPAIMTIRMGDPRKDAENIAQMLRALRENPQILEILENAILIIGEELAKKMKTTPRTGRRKVKMSEEVEIEEEEVEEEERKVEEKVEERKRRTAKKRSKSENEEVTEVRRVSIRRADELVEGEKGEGE